MLCIISHLTDKYVMLMKNCINVSHFLNPMNQIDNFILACLCNVPLYRSTIMGTYTQNLSATQVSNEWDLVNQYSYIPPFISLSFVSQPSPLHTYNNVPPTYYNFPPSYSQAPPTCHSFTPPL